MLPTWGNDLRFTHTLDRSGRRYRSGSNKFLWLQPEVSHSLSVTSNSMGDVTITITQPSSQIQSLGRTSWRYFSKVFRLCFFPVIVLSSLQENAIFIFTINICNRKCSDFCKYLQYLMILKRPKCALNASLQKSLFKIMSVCFLLTLKFLVFVLFLINVSLYFWNGFDTSVWFCVFDWNNAWNKLLNQIKMLYFYFCDYT